MMTISDPYAKIVAKALECRESVRETEDDFVSYLLEMLLEAAIKKADIGEIEKLAHKIYGVRKLPH